MTDKQKIADLEKRVKDLEARPQAPTIIVPPAVAPIPFIPQIPYVPVFPQPWTPWVPPFYVGDDPRFPTTITCDVASGVN